jgi:hypothetical protein
MGVRLERSVMRRIGVFAAFGIGTMFGWTACFLTAFAAGKKIDKDILKYRIKATED